MQQNKEYISEDEIDLKELFKTIWLYKKFIIIFTSLITIFSIVYVMSLNPKPIYKGSLLIEIGEYKTSDNEFIIVDNTNNLKIILENKFNAKVYPPQKTDSLLKIIVNNTNKNKIEKDINEVYNFVIERHTKKLKEYKAVIPTSKVDEIKVSNEPINKPKKKLVVSVTFVSAFIISIFLVFFIEFIKGIKKENKV
ncbi:hypothetical protein CRV02_00755 [Arcobacter sp. CECT 8989]|uniref:Wzz/FepE/Etk N-terminal domain-containing protein n=1 Tax=Arcobacter sp. CECT 8989 TaxID=2044509 RepID=UPI00100B8C85|nr:Wzz/FepE/Etk N-terminal domain-containing protein [Arcobacter sp. CECT 8989]RXK03755.1 hypothetical protein CRV02_00755 [Arcobacter sp. CECT 8989]